MKKVLAIIASSILMTTAYAGEFATMNVYNGDVHGTVVNTGNSLVETKHSGFPSGFNAGVHANYAFKLLLGETANVVYTVNSDGDACEFNFRNNGTVYYAGGPEKIDISAYANNYWSVECDVDATGTLRVGGWYYDAWDGDDWWDEECMIEDELCYDLKKK